MNDEEIIKVNSVSTDIFEQACLEEVYAFLSNTFVFTLSEGRIHYHITLFLVNFCRTVTIFMSILSPGNLVLHHQDKLISEDRWMNDVFSLPLLGFC